MELTQARPVLVDILKLTHRTSTTTTNKRQGAAIFIILTPTRDDITYQKKELKDSMYKRITIL